jgi:hypothetical protein
MMTFRDIKFALVDGKTIRVKSWKEYEYIYQLEGTIFDEKDNVVPDGYYDMYDNIDGWEIYTPKI